MKTIKIFLMALVILSCGGYTQAQSIRGTVIVPTGVVLPDSVVRKIAIIDMKESMVVYCTEVESDNTFYIDMAPAPKGTLALVIYYGSDYQYARKFNSFSKNVVLAPVLKYSTKAINLNKMVKENF